MMRYGLGASSDKGLNDSWAAGATLYRMVTGELLIGEPELKLLMSISNDRGKSHYDKHTDYLDELTTIISGKMNTISDGPLKKAMEGLLKTDINERRTVTAVLGDLQTVLAPTTSATAGKVTEAAARADAAADLMAVAAVLKTAPKV
jgi:hypothetical protein